MDHGNEVVNGEMLYRTRSVQTSRELGGRIDAARSGRYGSTEVATEPQVEIKRMECGKSCISRWPGGRVAVAVAHSSYGG